MAVRFPATSTIWNPSFCAGFRPRRSTGEHDGGVRFSFRRIPYRAGFHIACYQRLNCGSSGGSCFVSRIARNKVRATAEQLGSASDPIKFEGSAVGYHPSEEITELASGGSGEARLTTAETVRTIVQANAKATLLFSGIIGDEFHENILWKDLPYATDKHGNIYFLVNSEDEIVRSLASETHMVQVIIGVDAMEVMKDIEISGPAEIDFGIENIGAEDSDFEDDDDDDDDDYDDDYEEDWVTALDDEDDPDESDGSLGDWAKLDTMRFSHPISFSKKLAEVALDDPVDCMKRPPVGVVIRGILTQVVLVEKPVIPRLLSGHKSSIDVNNIEIILDNKIEDFRTSGQSQEPLSHGDGLKGEEGSKKDENMKNEVYKLEMIKIQLLSVHGNPSFSEVEDYQRAKPDLISQSASKIMSCLKAGGENTAEALKFLCWSCKGIQVEEATIIGIDSLGFDMKVCSGAQIQTLRFAFETRASTEHGAVRQLNDLLFTRMEQKPQKEADT